MTAEIAIINRTGVALAADSAVTIGRNRVWKSSNKLFHLAPNADVGIMVFGNDSHCGLPWEVIIKQYRRKISSKKFMRLNEYVNDFVSFVSTVEAPHPVDGELNSFHLMFDIIDSAKKATRNIKSKKERSKKFINELEFITSLHEDKNIIFDKVTEKSFSKANRENIKGFIEDETDLRVTKLLLTTAIRACFELSRREVPSDFETGIVFAGFGEEELLPVVHEIRIDGTLNGQPRAWTHRTHDMNKDASSGVIMPFAQSDIAHLFMEGLLPEYLSFIGRIMNATLDRKSKELIKNYVPPEERVVEINKQMTANEAMTGTFLDRFEKFRKEKFVQPMMRVTSSLPKEEMAALAEALVETTSLRRKMDSNLETVGGPVDVAVISKSDGYVWIKRKHYFDIDLNRDFIDRRRQRYSGGADDEKQKSF